MTCVVDTSVLVDYLRGHQGAAELLERERAVTDLHASEIARVEVLAGMRAVEEVNTRRVLSAFRWHVLDAEVAEIAGDLGRRWLPSHSGIDAADLVVAATAIQLNGRLLTTNVRHFPMFADLRRPYEG